MSKNILEQENDTLDNNTESVSDSIYRFKDADVEVEEQEEQKQVIWVSIKKLIPNPMNPRKNDSIRTDEMQNIILQRGWEEPLTAYEQGNIYVLLAGHRRLYAARKAGVKKVPIFVVEKPANDQEEIERIASLQSGRVDWTSFEWALFTYERWVAWGKPPVSRFAKQINLGIGAVKQYINVLDYYPRHEIQADLESKALSISSLDALVKWLKALKTHKADLVDSMGEDLIRKIMLDKIRNNKVNRDELRNTEYAKLASEEDIQEFLINKEMELDAQMGYLGIKKKYQDFNGHLISIGHMEKRIPEIKPETEHQREQALKALEELNQLINQQIADIKKI